MGRALLAAAALLLAAGMPRAGHAQRRASTGRPAAERPPAGSRHQGDAFTFTEVVPGVYHAVGTGTMGVGANAVVIVNAADVVLVDSHVSAAAAWVLRQELRRLTDKPVRTVVNTHWHYDHAHGNQLYGPDVEVIGHEETRRALLAGASQRGDAYEGLRRVLRQRQDSLRALLDSARMPAVRLAVRARLEQVRQYQAAVDDVTPTPPGLTLSRALVLHRGGREIQLLFLGRAHTAGDLVVWLPAERVLATGDLVGSGLPFLGDGYPDEWIATLDRLQALPWTVLLPGHGPPVRDRAVPARLQSVLRDFLRQGRALLAQGLSPAAAAARLDLSAHAAWYPALADPRLPDTAERFTIGLTRLQQLAGASR